MNLRKLGVVARFELGEALRSRLIIIVVSLYGFGAAFGVYVFSRMLEAFGPFGGARSGDAPEEVLRREALPRLLGRLVSDPELREELAGIDPLMLFYGFGALYLVALLVLLTSAGAHAEDRARGSTRYVLTRCDRWSWALGKLAAHAALLGLGLVLGALVTCGVAFARGHGDGASVLWLTRACLRAWVYGVAYLGILSGVALATPFPARARALSVLVLVALWVAYALTDSSWVLGQAPWVQHFAWVFPAHYKLWLGSPRWLESLAAAGALLGIGGGAFALGNWTFSRRDA